MSFIETPRFPIDIGISSPGGPNYMTSVVEVRSGHEQRNIDWTVARHVYQVGYGVKKIADIYTLLEYFHAMRGRAHSFRFKDYADYLSVEPQGTLTKDDQVLGTGDAAKVAFQIIKLYTAGSLTLTRTINKPVIGTIKVALDGVEKFDPGDFTTDTTTGIITFGVAPGASVVVSAGYEFDVPVRFDTDVIRTDFEAWESARLDVTVREIRI